MKGGGEHSRWEQDKKRRGDFFRFKNEWDSDDAMIAKVDWNG